MIDDDSVEKKLGKGPRSQTALSGLKRLKEVRKQEKEKVIPHQQIPKPKPIQLQNEIEPQAQQQQGQQAQSQYPSKG